MDASDENICIPGTCLSLAEEYTPGNGTYVRNGYIYSCLTGYVKIENQNDQSKIISVVRGNEKNVIPITGNVVTAKISSISSRLCKCRILCIEKTVLKEPFHGIIRKEDIRATEKDKIEVYKCFRPGDIVLARVHELKLSLGDANAYVLSTAENELGVVIALSESGYTMVPISWTEMQCPVTFVRELRKVAKVIPENASIINRHNKQDIQA